MTKGERMSRFLGDRFGMFIHWGLYAVPAKGEWLRSYERISNENYQKYFDSFDPTKYNPREWAKLCKEAGMKYAVMTTKHHDGFCLFDTKLTDYKATNTKAGRDLTREYVDAFRAEGIKVGFYYSLVDWHHPDFPAYHDKYHPMRDNETYKDLSASQDFSRYVEYFHGQVRELLTNYGKIDMMWFDFSYDEMTGEKWQAQKLVRMIRELQPDIVIDDRLGTESLGDYVSPEQRLPRRGIVDAQGNSVPWEACVTLNEHWGYCADDHDYKQPRDIVRALVECVSKNGNLLLNVGPDATGCIPDESVAILKQVGAWIQKNGDSIYGCGASELEKPEWGRLTKKGNKLYVHILERGVGAVVIEGMAGAFKFARFLCDGSEVNITSITPLWSDPLKSTDFFLNLSGYRLPDALDTVVELQYAE